MLTEQELRTMWKVRPSEREQYSKTYYTTTPEGDELVVDFNFGREMVQIHLTLAKEYGREYLAVIKSGTILRERDQGARRQLDLTSRIYPLRKYFSYFPDELALKAIGGNYGLPELPHNQKPGERPPLPPSAIVTFQEAPLWEKLKAFLKERRETYQSLPFFGRCLRRLPAEFLDISFGCLILWSYLQSYLTAGELAGLLGFLGIGSGALDWFWRQRGPFLPKVILLLTGSALAVYYQIQYRLWGIFI